MLYFALDKRQGARVPGLHPRPVAGACSATSDPKAEFKSKMTSFPFFYYRNLHPINDRVDRASATEARFDSRLGQTKDCCI